MDQQGTGRRLITTVAAAALLTVPLAACGSETSNGGDSPRAAPATSEFPDPEGASLEDILARYKTSELVILPAAQVFTVGRNRLGFGVFTVDGEQVTDAEVAMYAAPGSGGPARGPFPARVESLETDPAFVSRSTAEDPDSAKVVYASEPRFSRAGEWRLVALVRHEGELAATRLPSVVIDAEDPIPAPGEKAPRVHTPTADDVGDISAIDTRDPHSTLHEHDLADVVGSDPVVLLFATPALCQSRVCGPVVDVAEQVGSDRGDDAAFIYSEVYEQNDPNKGLREPVREFNLPTEPWLFVIDGDGNVDTRIEGPFSVAELEDAVDRVTR